MSYFYLHGMGGSTEDWAAVRKYLPGEALTIPPGLSIADTTHALADQLCEQRDIQLCGYSMGGRIAILLASELINRGVTPRGLALLGAGLGFSSEREQAERRALDEKWAQLATTDPAGFWENWYGQPLFSSFRSLPAAQRESWLQGRKSMDISTLISQLRKLGPGEHKDLFPELVRIKNAGISVLYLAGELDKKYLILGQKLAQEPGVELGIIPGAGHILPLEAPELVADWLKIPSR